MERVYMQLWRLPKEGLVLLRGHLLRVGEPASPLTSTKWHPATQGHVTMSAASTESGRSGGIGARVP